MNKIWNNKKIFAIGIIVLIVFIFSQYRNVASHYLSGFKTQEEIEIRKMKNLLDAIKTKTEGKSLSELGLITGSKISEKLKTLILFYIPAKICFVCVEDFVKTIAKKNKKRMALIIENLPNPSIIGLVKYFKLQDISIYDKDNIFSKKILNNAKVKKPLALVIKKKIIQKSFIIGDEVENDIEILFNELNK